MNRIDRITAILIQLQSKRVVKAQEIADRFGISLRTVYRDIRTLEEAGIPMIGEAGIGYSIMDGYRLPPVMFTKEEATAFLTAEKLIERFTDQAITEHYRSAMFKIKAVLRRGEKEFLEDIDPHIEVVRQTTSSDDNIQDNVLTTILNSITEKKVLSMQYHAIHNEKITKRHVEPIGVFFQEGHWHLIAFCQLRNDYRNFRVDRITHFQTIGHTFKTQHVTLKEYLQQVSQERALQTVVVRFDKTVLKYLREQKYYYGFVSEQDLGHEVEMTFLTFSLEAFARWLLMFGDTVEIISPEILKNEIRELIQILQQHFC